MDVQQIVGSNGAGRTGLCAAGEAPRKRQFGRGKTQQTQRARDQSNVSRREESVSKPKQWSGSGSLPGWSGSARTRTTTPLPSVAPTQQQPQQQARNQAAAVAAHPLVVSPCAGAHAARLRTPPLRRSDVSSNCMKYAFKLTRHKLTGWSGHRKKWDQTVEGLETKVKDFCELSGNHEKLSVSIAKWSSICRPLRRFEWLRYMDTSSTLFLCCGGTRRRACSPTDPCGERTRRPDRFSRTRGTGW